MNRWVRNTRKGAVLVCLGLVLLIFAGVTSWGLRQPIYGDPFDLRTLIGIRPLEWFQRFAVYAGLLFFGPNLIRLLLGHIVKREDERKKQEAQEAQEAQVSQVTGVKPATPRPNKYDRHIQHKQNTPGQGATLFKQMQDSAQRGQQ